MESIAIIILTIRVIISGYFVKATACFGVSTQLLKCKNFIEKHYLFTKKCSQRKSEIFTRDSMSFTHIFGLNSVTKKSKIFTFETDTRIQKHNYSQ